MCETLIKSVKSLFSIQQEVSNKPILYIICDSNPNVGMGYILLGNRNLDCAELSQIAAESTHVLSKLPPGFEKIFQLDRILTSTFFELKGLLCFVIRNISSIKKLCHKTSRITFVCDNAGLFCTNTGFSKNPLIRALQTVFLEYIANINTPWNFTWLRRSHHLVTHADQERRVALIHVSPRFFLSLFKE